MFFVVVVVFEGPAPTSTMSFAMFKKHKRTPAELATKLGNALNTLAEGGDDKVRRFSVPKVSRSISAARPRLSPRERGPTAR